MFCHGKTRGQIAHIATCHTRGNRDGDATKRCSLGKQQEGVSVVPIAHVSRRLFNELGHVAVHLADKQPAEPTPPFSRQLSTLHQEIIKKQKTKTGHDHHAIGSKHHNGHCAIPIAQDAGRPEKTCRDSWRGFVLNVSLEDPSRELEKSSVGAIRFAKRTSRWEHLRGELSKRGAVKETCREECVQREAIRLIRDMICRYRLGSVPTVSNNACQVPLARDGMCPLHQRAPSVL